MLPVCLNSLLYKYEADIAELLTATGRKGEAPVWEGRAEARKKQMNALMWNDASGLYSDLIKVGGEWRKNGYEDLRGLMPMWAGMVKPGGSKAAKMIARVPDFERKGGLACATADSFEKARALNPEFVARCQWGNENIGWPIATYETVVGMKKVGAKDEADEIAYRWCWMVQREMDRNGGLQYSDRGGFEAPIMEKMDVTSLSQAGEAKLGYGNQGAGREGEHGGFRWGYDAYKLLERGLPERLKSALANGVDPDLLFSDAVRFAANRK
jgi:alpha,alpha-trehalase